MVGLASNADAMASYFDARFFLTADIDLILERLRGRDGAAHATRFAAFGSAAEWQRFAESRWSRAGYTPVDSSGPPAEVAETLVRLLQLG